MVVQLCPAVAGFSDEPEKVISGNKATLGMCRVEGQLVFLPYV